MYGQVPLSKINSVSAKHSSNSSERQSHTAFSHASGEKSFVQSRIGS